MRPQDIKVGETYRHRTSPHYAYAKVIAILKPKQGVNTKAYTIVECEWTVGRDDPVGMIKYFRPCDLIKLDT